AKHDGDEEKRCKSNDTHAKNTSQRWVRVKDPATQACPSESNHSDPGEVRPVTQHGRSCIIHALSHSPSPRSTNCKPKQSTQVPGESQYTYKYETLDHKGLVNCVQEEFSLDVHGCNTQTIINRIWLAMAEQASQIVMLPPTPFQVGGGWSQEVVGGSQSTRSCKRTSQVTADFSKGSSTHQCMEPLVDDNTVTELETDNEPTIGPEPPQHGKQAPSPLCKPTTTTVLDSQPSNMSSHSLGGSVTRSCPHSQGISLSPSGDQPSAQALPPSEDKPPLKKTKCPQVLAPLCGPVHTCLCAELLTRHAIDTVNNISQALSHANNQTDEVQSDLNEVPKTQSSSNLCTYRGCHSHLPSEPGATATQSTGATNPADGPDEPSNLLTPSQLIQRECTWAVAAKAHEGMSKVPPRPCPMLAATSQLPASRPQSRLPLRGNAAAVQCVGGTSRQLDPVSAAHEDMLAFNQAVAQESHWPDELLDDNEEILMQAEAYAKQKWPRHHAHPACPARPACPACIRKQKPLAWDVSGIARQVLMMAKIHLLAYALVEGVYQTCATYLQWASRMHQATWEMDLPDHPYEKPDDEIFEVMVNSIATSRGRVKEQLCEFVARVSGFQHTTTNQKFIEMNLIIFNRLYPNSYHCKTITPHSGEYENLEIAHCIALAMFYGPNLVRVLYPDYFRDMPLTAVAFTLTIWQFCIKEWANSWQQNGDLGMASMCKKYESQLAGLKELHEVTPSNLFIILTRTIGAQVLDAPDTPEPDAISVEEMDSCLLETTHQNSICSCMEELMAKELVQPMDINESDSEGSQAPTSHSPSPSLTKHNQYGILTSCTKGKGHAN
ncbi:hypothetical protein FRC11_000497, partial [Ceratobasidium sp. 423]